MKEIQLTQGQVALVDDEDFDSLNQFSWCALKRSNGDFAYAARTVYNPKRTVYMHVMINGPKTDHHDCNGLNNQRYNLRSANSQQNNRNKFKYKGTYSSKFKGVSYRHDNGMYRAYIRVNGVLISKGQYWDEIDAAKAYDKAAIEEFGEFANLNFPLDKCDNYCIIK